MNTVREIMTGKVNGSSFITIDTETEVKLTGGRANPMQGRVTKVTMRSNVMVFQNKNGNNAYENMVNRRLVAEGKDPGSFSVGPRAWGQREANSPFVTHEGKEYLEVIFLRKGETHYRLDGRPVDKNTIQGLPVSSQEGEQGGISIENRVIIRTFAFESILAITVDKETHIVSGLSKSLQQTNRQSVA